MLPSKVDRILSRYRPIAPKLPLPAPQSASFPTTDLSSNCTASLDSAAKVRRSRKRLRIAPASSSGTKCLRACKSERPQLLCTTNAGLTSSPPIERNFDRIVPHIDFSNASLSCVASENGTPPSQHVMMDVSDWSRVPLGETAVVAPSFHPQHLVEQARMFMVVDALKARNPSLPAHSGHLGGLPCSHGMTEKEVAFMDRAAASARLPEKGVASDSASNNIRGAKAGGYAVGGFTELIRGITHLPTVADVQSLMQVRSIPTGMEAPASACMSAPGGEAREISTVGIASHQQSPESQSWGSRPPAQAPQLQSSSLADDGTLSLLPICPSRHPPQSCCLSAFSPSNRSTSPVQPSLDFKISPLDEDKDALLGSGSSPTGLLCDSKQSQEETGVSDGHVATTLSPFETASSAAPHCGLMDVSAVNHSSSVMDNVYLHQVYDGSTDPVLLVDDSGQALWCNKAYERAFKSVQGRTSGGSTGAGPYIDPLGHPTPLGCFALSRSGLSDKRANATLWGFLKRLVLPKVDATEDLLGSLKPDPRTMGCFSNNVEACSLSLNFTGTVHVNMPRAKMDTAPVSMANVANDVEARVSTGNLTTVSLESITNVYMDQSASAAESVETAQARLQESGSLPAFITDRASRVKWFNAAFKQMLGQPKQNHGRMLTALHLADMCATPNELPELMFVGSAEKIPWSAWAFSCLVNLEWMKSGKRRSMTVPCDVSRLAPAATWVWKFDLALSLSLNPFG